MYSFLMSACPHASDSSTSPFFGDSSSLLLVLQGKRCVEQCPPFVFVITVVIIALVTVTCAVLLRHAPPLPRFPSVPLANGDRNIDGQCAPSTQSSRREASTHPNEWTSNAVQLASNCICNTCSSDSSGAYTPFFCWGSTHVHPIGPRRSAIVRPGPRPVDMNGHKKKEE